MANWEKFDKAINVADLANEVNEADKNGGSGDFKEVPHGEYEMKVQKLELTTSKAGDPMLSCWMKVIEGGFKGSLIFLNRVVTLSFQLHIANEFLRSLDSGVEITFKSYSQYAKLVMDVAEAIDGKLEYCLDYSEGKKGFSNYEITEVFEVKK